MNFGTNHLGHFLLTILLLPLVKNSAATGFHPRIVIIASLAHILMKNGLNFDDLMLEKKFDGLTSYASSKMANVLHAKELARRLQNTGITVYALHPGDFNIMFMVVGNRIVTFIFRDCWNRHLQSIGRSKLHC